MSGRCACPVTNGITKPIRSPLRTMLLLQQLLLVACGIIEPLCFFAIKYVMNIAATSTLYQNPLGHLWLRGT
ncbi:hypothetical protein HID58_038472 [Brassica napus]|uniref:Uncharacterized protein n=1 Tax=Brassica napus TaxID=3708 RepID=A0ABQ8BP86_BRANA|nr:hypothetical protein HID58_038472 [Brassica napus]